MARRSGGRQARHALRSAPLAEHIKPVNPGEPGGQYKPLSDLDVAAINDNIFRILEEVGFNEATPHCIDACTAVGAVLGDDGRLRMPRPVVEKALEQAERNLVLYGQDPQYDRQIQGSRVHFATGGAAVMIADTVNNCYRESTSQDLYDLARIVDTCEHIHIFQRMCVLVRTEGHRRQLRDGSQHHLLLGYRHEQTCRCKLDTSHTSREDTRDAAHHCGR